MGPEDLKLSRIKTDSDDSEEWSPVSGSVNSVYCVMLIEGGCTKYLMQGCKGFLIDSYFQCSIKLINHNDLLLHNLFKAFLYVYGSE